MKTKILISLVCLIAVASNGTAQDKEKEKGAKSTPAGAPTAPDRSPPSVARKSEIKVGVVITAAEREVIRGYCVQFEQPGKKGKKAKSLPPGLAKKLARGGRLPPGWEKKLVKGEIMPEPVFKECHPLAKEVVIKLPVPPSGTILRAIHGKIVRLHEKTREILDVFDPFH